MCNVASVVEEADKRFFEIFGRSHGTMVNGYKTEDAELALLLQEILHKVDGEGIE